MTIQEFITSFNKGNQHQKSKLVVQWYLREPAQHLAMSMSGNSPYESFHILGYTEKRVGLWYAKTKTGNTILMTAFALRPSGEETFKEWAIRVPINFAEANKKIFIESFDNLVMPEHLSN